MPNRGTMRAKQRRGGSLGQGTRFYYLGGTTLTRIAGAQGFGKTDPSIGSAKSLGVMKQNRNAGGNNTCEETAFFSPYYTQSISLSVEQAGVYGNTGDLVYKNGTTQLLGSLVVEGGLKIRLVGQNPLEVGTINLAVTIVLLGQGFPGISGTILTAQSPVENIEVRQGNCNCRGPKGYCPNCSGRANPLSAITGGAGYSSTTGFTLLSH